MNIIGWTVLGNLAWMWVFALRKWGYWQGQAAEWKARAEVRDASAKSLKLHSPRRSQ